MLTDTETLISPTASRGPVALLSNTVKDVPKIAEYVAKEAMSRSVRSERSEGTGSEAEWQQDQGLGKSAWGQSFPDCGQSFPMVPYLSNRAARRRWRATANRSLQKATILNKWEGQVTDLTENGFKASVEELGKSRNAVEIVEFNMSEIAMSDRTLIREGAIFYWYILCSDSLSGDRGVVSRLWFRRRGRLSQEQFDKRLDAVKETWKIFGWNEP